MNKRVWIMFFSLCMVNYSVKLDFVLLLAKHRNFPLFPFYARIFPPSGDPTPFPQNWKKNTGYMYHTTFQHETSCLMDVYKSIGRNAMHKNHNHTPCKIRVIDLLLFVRILPYIKEFAPIPIHNFYFVWYKFKNNSCLLWNHCCINMHNQIAYVSQQ